MNWKCKLGFHDWEQISYKSHSNIENEIRREMRKGEPTRPISVGWSPDQYYEDKICLRCNKRVDEITPHKEKVYADILKKKARVLQRKKLLHNKILY